MSEELQRWMDAGRVLQRLHPEVLARTLDVVEALIVAAPEQDPSEQEAA